MDGYMGYALVFLFHYVDFDDYGILCRIEQGDFWVAKSDWFCQNAYPDGQTELVRGWTYTIWEDEPTINDRHPLIPGFSWTDRNGNGPLSSVNYIFFEQMFPDLIIDDTNELIYVEAADQPLAPPAIIGWEIATTHGHSVGELWYPVQDGYVEPRANGIVKLGISFDQPMDITNTDPNVISIYTEPNVFHSNPHSIAWKSGRRMVVMLRPALPDQQTYTISIAAGIQSVFGDPLKADSRLCLTALMGDSNASGAVNAQDMLAVRTHLGETVAANNARFDVNCSGAIDVQDVLMVNANVGHGAKH
jgi:hypothetical protein